MRIAPLRTDPALLPTLPLAQWYALKERVLAAQAEPRTSHVLAIALTLAIGVTVAACIALSAL